MDRATKKQQELLTFVSDFIKQHGYGPSYREIMNGLAYKSVSTVAVHVEGLISKGLLARNDNAARSLVVVDQTLQDSQAIKEIKAKMSSLNGEDGAPKRDILKQAIEILRT